MSGRPLKVFVSYAHEDDAHRAALASHLAELEREGLLTLWHDRRLTAGREWAGAIDAALHSADLVLLLISRDFLGSDYCNDVELAEAMRLHDAGRLRVVPVILRSCDWRHSKFAHLSALPTDGLPVVEAAYPDQRYTEVAEGLRALIGELAAAHDGVVAPATAGVPGHAAPSPAAMALALSARRPRRPGVIATLALALVAALVLAGGAGFLVVRRPMAEAHDALRMARYDLAGQALQGVPGALAHWPGLALLRQKADLGQRTYQVRPDWEAIGRQLQQLRAAWPDDADLLVLDASQALRQPDYPRARTLAQAATAADPRHAEAWYLRGLERDLAGDLPGAIAHYRQASALAPDSPPYRNNLARALLESGQPEPALAEYRQIRQFPLARVEEALALWALGRPQEAADAQRTALQQLADAELMARFYNRREWVFLLADTGVGLGATEAKRCYAWLGLAASQRLAGDAGAAMPPEACTQPSLALRRLLADDLCRFAEQPQPSLAGPAGALRRALGQAESCPPAAPAPASKGTAPAT